jgi:hypothetical protein
MGVSGVSPRVNGTAMEAVSPTLYADAGQPSAKSGEARYSAGGIKMRGQPLVVQTVADINAITGHVQTGQLMWGRTHTGTLLFWIKGSSTQTVLRGTNGKAITNVTEALARAKELIRNAAVPRLRDLGAPAALPSMGGPDTSELTIDLERSAEAGGVNRRGGTGREALGLVLRGEPGSALTCAEALARAQGLGVPVRVVNDNDKSGLGATNVRLSANITLKNNEAGGRQYANITVSRSTGYDPDGTSYSMPAGASAAFKRGYATVESQIGGARLNAITQNLSSGAVAVGSRAQSRAPAPRPTSALSPTRRANQQPGLTTPTPSAAVTRASDRPSLKQVASGRLPTGVADMATALGVNARTVRKVMDSLGGNFDTQSAISYLQKDHGLSLQKATSLVGAVRSAQNQSTRDVGATIKAAAARTDATGASSPQFTEQDWAQVSTALKAQPKVDNGAARLLTRLLSDPRFVKNGQSTISARPQIERYLRSIGGSPGQAGQPTASAPWQPENPTQSNAGFARLVARTGQGQQEAVRVGVVDDFHQTVPAANQLNTDAVVRLPASSRRQNGAKTDRGGQHGSLVTATSTAGAGKWLRAQVGPAGSLSAVVNSIDAMARSGVRVINCSFVFENLQSAMTMRKVIDRYPNVLFVVSAGNGNVSAEGYSVGANLRDSALGQSLLANRRNVLYVGNTTSTGQIASTSSYGTPGPHLYALGTDLVAPDGRNRYKDFNGASASAPAVARAVGQMLFLDPKMSVAGARQVVMQTARSVKQEAPHALAGQSVAVLDAKAATTVAALTGLVRGGSASSLAQAADQLKLGAEQRARLLPLASRALTAKAGATPATNNISSGAQNTRPPNTARASATGDPTTDALFSDAPSRVTYPDGAMQQGKASAVQIKRLTGGLDNTMVEVRDAPMGSVVLKVVKQRGGGELTLSINNGTMELVSERNVWRLKNDAASPAQATLPRAIAIAAAQAQALGLERFSVTVQEGGAGAHVRLADLGFNNIKNEWSLQASMPRRYFVNGSQPNDITAMRASAEGRTWWRENGQLAKKLTFDLTPGSTSWQTLQAYLRTHNIRLPAGTTLPQADPK